MAGQKTGAIRGKISIFGKSGYPHCQKAKEYLAARNIPYHRTISISEYLGAKNDGNL